MPINKINFIKSVTRAIIRWYNIVWKKCSASGNCIHNNINCNTHTTNYAEILILKPIRTKVIEYFRIALYIIIIYSRSLRSPYYQVSTSDSYTVVKCSIVPIPWYNRCYECWEMLSRSRYHAVFEQAPLFYAD